jgi:hypothetical protein
MTRYGRFFGMLLIATLPAVPARADDPQDLFRNGHFFGELRYRYEEVKQDGVPTTAQANTVRADLGFETGLFYDLTAHADFQAVRHFGADDFNDLENGKTSYPKIADPDRSQFREAWILWTGLPQTALKGGRQEITFDNQRFIGNTDWRQSDQTFDAGTAKWTPLDGLALTYSYIWNINRVAGPDYTGGTQLFHASYDYADWLRAAAYDYRVDINQNATLSSHTYGVQVTGQKALNEDFEIDYLAEYARQSDAGDNPDDYSLRYWHLTPSLLWKNIILQAGFESLGGNGTDAVQTPIATLHAFNGWADMFLTTPVNGLDDRYARISYRLDKLHPWIDGTSLDAVYHDFNAERTAQDYGREWDFRAQKSFETTDFLTKEWTLTAKYAAYRADTMFAATDKFWLMVGTKF